MTRVLLVTCLAAALLSGCKRPADETAAPAAPAATAPAPAQTPPANAATEPASTPAPDAPKPETPALRVTTTDGKPYDLAAHRGKWVVVNYWATWCAPCRKEMPELSALDAMRENVEVIGLAYEDIAPADMAAFLKEHPVVYPIAVVDTMNPPVDFDTPRGLPMTYLIAPDGKVAKQFLGPITAKDLEAEIAKAGGSRPDPAG